MQRDAKTPQEYLDMVPEKQRGMIETIREAIFAAVPDVEEINEYGMLGYKGLGNLAAQKQYVALYMPATVVAQHKPNFPGLNCGKVCMRFRRPEQLDPEKLRALVRDAYAWRQANPDADGC